MAPLSPPSSRGLSESPPPQADRARTAASPTTVARMSFFIASSSVRWSGGTGGAEEPRRDHETAQAREDQLDDQREQHDQYRAPDDELVVVARQPVDDVAAEAAETRIRGDGGGGDDLDRGRPQPQQDQRQ